MTRAGQRRDPSTAKAEISGDFDNSFDMLRGLTETMPTSGSRDGFPSLNRKISLDRKVIRCTMPPASWFSGQAVEK
jgi:hypothetical protein